MENNNQHDSLGTTNNAINEIVGGGSINIDQEGKGIVDIAYSILEHDIKEPVESWLKQLPMYPKCESYNLRKQEFINYILNSQYTNKEYKQFVLVNVTGNYREGTPIGEYMNKPNDT